MPSEHPHILKFCTDEHAPQVCGYAGDPWVRTPNLDRLAAEGVVFDNCYCANPICVPGRNAMITGQLVREVGTLYYSDVLPSGLPTYMRQFSEHGYQTTCVGKMHFHGQDQMHGWLFRPYGDMEILLRQNMPGYSVEKDVVGPTKYRPGQRGLPHWIRDAHAGETGFMGFDRSVTREAGIHLRDYFRRIIYPVYSAERPLLFEVSWKCPHWPFTAPQELFDYYRGIVGPPEKALPEGAPPSLHRKHAEDQPDDITEEQILNARAGYWALCEWVDMQIGVVLDTLKELGVRDEFAVMYCSDHGEMAGEHGLWAKHCFYEESARVPMILSGPGIPAGRRVGENVSLTDIFPTLCDVAGLPTPEGLRGRSMLPLTHDPPQAGERMVFSELYGETCSFMAKKGDVKYICHSDGSRQVFDLARDPGELDNVADRPEYAGIRRQLHDALAALPDPWHAGEPDYQPPPGMPRPGGA